MAQPKSAASQIYPHLPSGERPEVKQRPNSLADAMWPSLSPKPPPGWDRESISLIQSNIRQGRSDSEIARGYGVSKQAVAQIRKLGR
jgi:hypothetical protein